MRNRFTALLVLIAFVSSVLAPYGAQAQILPYMPDPGQMIFAGEDKSLPVLAGLRFNSDNPFDFTFVVNGGDVLRDESLLRPRINELAKYFLAALTIPENDLWVNLSPYEPERVITAELGRTELGRDLLGEDYVLKQLAASLTYPDSETGKKYWQSINGVGANNHSPVNNFNKVWIVPDKIHIYESPSMVVIDYARLKVLTETDYLATQKNSGNGDGSIFFRKNRTVPISDSTIAFKKYILPSIEKEVNQGKHFAHLRQIYSAVILATWFKQRLKDTILNERYFDQKKIKGADTADKAIREKIYAEYVKAFQQGVYNYVKKESVGANDYSPVKKIIRRAYFSGGIVLGVTAKIEVSPVTDASAAVAARRAGIEADALAEPKVLSGVVKLAGSPDTGEFDKSALLLDLLERGQISRIRILSKTELTEKDRKAMGAAKRAKEEGSNKEARAARSERGPGFEARSSGNQRERYFGFLGFYGMQKLYGLVRDYDKQEIFQYIVFDDYKSNLLKPGENGRWVILRSVHGNIGVIILPKSFKHPPVNGKVLLSCIRNVYSVVAQNLGGVNLDLGDKIKADGEKTDFSRSKALAGLKNSAIEGFDLTIGRIRISR